MIWTDVRPVVASAIAAVGLRAVGGRFGRPAAWFAAGAAGLALGWSLCGGRLWMFAAAAGVAAALMVRTGTGKKGAGKGREDHVEGRLWLAALGVFGAWLFSFGAIRPVAWLGVPVACVEVMVAIGAAGLLARDAWEVAAAAICLGAAQLAAGLGWLTAAPAFVVGAACLAGTPLLPLAAGLGAAGGLSLLHTHRLGLGFVPLAPLVCLALLAWRRGWFSRLGRGAAPVRAGLAAGLVCVLAYSAAAMAGLR